MLTRKDAIVEAQCLINELRSEGYSIDRSMLFGSFVNETQHEHSDIDLALWDKHFSGCMAADYEPIKHVLSKYPRIELHTFHQKDNRQTNPFVEVIEKQGVNLH